MGALCLIVIVGIPTFLVLRKRRMGRELDAWLPASGWSAAPCPVGALGPRPMSDSRCYSGQVAGHPVTLLLGRRWKGETANIPRNSGIAQESFIGVVVPGVSEAWTASWKAKVGYGGADPVRVESGVVVWSGLWERATVEARLAELGATLTKP